jgi:RHS repeat-associated protein
MPTSFASPAVTNPTISTTNNRLSSSGYTYDNSGNLTANAEGQTHIYDAENKQIEVKNSSNVTIGQYWYDGDGKRVKKYAPGTGEITIFVYDASGKLIGEYSTLLNPTPQVSYLTNDHLGGPRINMDQNGAVISRHDYHPFGEEITGGLRIGTLGYAADDNRKQFTGYERDDETGLDFAQARMYANRLGRFTTVDPVTLTQERLIDPQRINLYAYVRNNPLILVDVFGEDLSTPGTKSQQDSYNQDLSGAANEKGENWKLKTVDGKVQFDGPPPERPKDPALARIYDAITTKTTNATVTLTEGPGGFVGNPEANNQTVNLTNVATLAQSKIPGTSTSDTIFHETYEAILMQQDKVADKDAAHAQATKDTGVGGVTGPGVLVQPEGSVIGTMTPVTIIKGNVKTEAFYLVKFNPEFKIKGKDAKQNLDRLSNDLKSGKIKQQFVGVQRR